MRRPLFTWGRRGAAGDDPLKAKHLILDFDPESELEDIYCPACDHEWEEDLPPYGHKMVECPACGQNFSADWDDFYNEETGDCWDGWVLTAVS